MDGLGFPGPGDPEQIAANVTGAYVQAGIAAVLLLASLGLWLLCRSHWLWPSICGCLVLLHPAWTVGVRGDDGARQKLEIAFAFTAVAAVALAGQLCLIVWKLRRNSRSQKADGEE